MRRSQVRIPSQAPLRKPHKLSVYAALLFLQRILFCNLKILKNLKKLEVCKSVCKSNNIRKLIILHRLTTEFTTRFDIQTQVFSTFLWKFITITFYTKSYPSYPRLDFNYIIVFSIIHYILWLTSMI